MEKPMASSEFDYAHYISLIKKNKALSIISALAIMTVITVVSYLMPIKYEAMSTVFIEKSVITELLKGLTFTSSAEDKIKGLLYALNSRTLIIKVLDELDLKKGGDEKLEKTIKEFQESTQIKIKDREGLFIISFKHRNAKLARNYVNALVRRYIDENTSKKREESYGASSFVSEQLAALKEKLDKADAAAKALRIDTGPGISGDGPSAPAFSGDTLARLDELKTRRSAVEAAMAGLNKSGSVQTNLHASQRRLQELQTQYTESYPEIQRVKEQIQALEGQLRNAQASESSPEYLRLAAELRQIRLAEAKLGKVGGGSGRRRSGGGGGFVAEDKYASIIQERLSLKTLYDSMLARQNQSEVSKQMEVQDKATVFRIVDPAVVPFKPVSPNRVKIILLGILAGIAGGLGAALLKDQLDGTVKGLDMVKQLGLPVLAVIPRVEDPQQVLLQSKRDRMLYIASSAYFMFILVVLAVEAVEGSLISGVISRLTS